MQGKTRVEGFNNPLECRDLGVSVMDKDKRLLNQSITPFEVEGESVIARMLRDAVMTAGVVIRGRMSGTLTAASTEQDVKKAVKVFKDAEDRLRTKRKRGLQEAQAAAEKMAKRTKVEPGPS